VTRVPLLAFLFTLGSVACDSETTTFREDPELWVQVVGGTDVRTHAVFELSGDGCEQWSSVTVWQDQQQLTHLPVDEEGLLPSTVEIDLREAPRPPTLGVGDPPAVTVYAACDSGVTVTNTVVLPASLVATQGWPLPVDHDTQALAIEDDGHRLLCADALVRLDEQGTESARTELPDSCRRESKVLRSDAWIAVWHNEAYLNVFDRATLSPRWEGGGSHLGLDPELDGAVTVTAVESSYAESPSDPVLVERCRFVDDPGLEDPSWSIEVATAVDDATFAVEAVGADEDRAWLVGIRSLPSTPPLRTLERWWIDASGAVDVEPVVTLASTPTSDDPWVRATPDGRLVLLHEDGMLQVFDLNDGTVLAQEGDIGRPREWIVAGDIWVASRDDLLWIDGAGDESARKSFAGPIAGLRAADARVGVFVDFTSPSLERSTSYYDRSLEPVWTLNRSVQALTVSDDGRVYLMTDSSALFVL